MLVGLGAATGGGGGGGAASTTTGGGGGAGAITTGAGGGTGVTAVIAGAGGVAGVGDLPGISRFREPFAGGELVTQVGVGFDHPMGAWVLNLGGQSTFPLTNRQYPYEDATGDSLDSVIAPGLYVTADTRVDIPLSQQAAFVVGAGVDLAYFLIPLPRGAIAVRWIPRRLE